MIGDKVKFITYCPECGSKLVQAMKVKLLIIVPMMPLAPHRSREKYEHFISQYGLWILMDSVRKR